VVRLTVTDDAGRTDAVTTSVRISGPSAPPPIVAPPIVVPPSIGGGGGGGGGGRADLLLLVLAALLGWRSTAAPFRRQRLR
jgi:hypothetical protein